MNWGVGNPCGEKEVSILCAFEGVVGSGELDPEVVGTLSTAFKRAGSILSFSDIGEETRGA
jgi:hypothetical protein